MFSKINEVGWGTTVTAFLLNIGNTMLEWKVNEVLTVLISVFSLIYLFLRIIEKLMTIRRQRRIDMWDERMQELTAMDQKIKQATDQPNEKATY